jgi:hypothetical protein
MQPDIFLLDIIVLFWDPIVPGICSGLNSMPEVWKMSLDDRRDF